MSAAREAEPARMGRILVVDDDPSIREVLLEALRSRGYQAEGAEDGLQALARLQHGPYDAIVTDFHMPRLDGLALLREVRRMRVPLRVIVQTGAWDPFLVSCLRQGGAFQVLPKGVPVGDLIRSVEQACRASREAPAPSRCA